MLDNGYATVTSLPPRKGRSQSRNNEDNKLDRQFEILRCYPWFHGCLSRGEAEKRVAENGSFLVRASNSSNGFVVTTRWNGRHNHVVILPASNQSNEKFHFDDVYSFDNVHDLIHFYKDSQMPISEDCGSILFTLVSSQDFGDDKNSGPRYRRRSRGNSASRTKPVHKVKARLKKFGSEPLLLPAGSEGGRPRRSSNTSVGSNGESTERQQSTTTPHYPPRANSLSSMTVGNLENGSTCPRRLSDVSQGQDKKQNGVESRNIFMGLKKKVFGSDSHILDSVGRKPARPLPRNSPEVSKKSRPNITIRNVAQFYDDGGGDYTDYAQVRAISSSTRIAVTTTRQGGDYVTMEDSRSQSETTNLSVSCRTNLSTNSRSSYQSYDGSDAYVLSSCSTTNSQLSIEKPRDSFSDSYGSFPSPDPMMDSQLWNVWLMTGPLMPLPPETKHLPAFNKPLDASVWTTVLRLLADTSEDILAGYIADESCRLLQRFPSTCKIPSVNNGYQLILISKAECYREHLINRSYCLSRFVAASILMCKPHERNIIMKKWINVAESLAVVYRDYYSLHSVSDGIFCNQVLQIVNTFSLLPQPSTLASMVCREFRISHRSGDDCCTSPHIDIVIPNVAHFIHVYSASYDDLKLETPESLWELISAARSWANISEGTDVERTSTPRHLWVKEMKVDTSVPILAELFTTEVQMKLLWGHRGYSVPASDRHQKFEVILNAFAKKALTSAS